MVTPTLVIMVVMLSLVTSPFHVGPFRVVSGIIIRVGLVWGMGVDR